MPSAFDMAFCVGFLALQLCLFLLRSFLQLEIFFADTHLSLATFFYNYVGVQGLDTFMSGFGLFHRWPCFALVLPFYTPLWAWLALVTIEVHALRMALEFIDLAILALTDGSVGFALASKDTSDDSDDESEAQKSDDSSGDADTSLDELKREIQLYLPLSSLAEKVAPTSASSVPTSAPAAQEAAWVTVTESIGFTGIPDSAWSDGDDSGYGTDDENASDEELVIQEKKPVILQLQTCALPPMPETSQSLVRQT
jgi:hypothetical protein